MKNFFLLMVMILFAACSKPEVEPGTLSKAYVEITIAKEEFPKGSDSLANVTQNIFSKYNISAEDYYSTLKNYETDQKKWDEFFKQSKNYLDSLKTLNKSK